MQQKYSRALALALAAVLWLTVQTGAMAAEEDLDVRLNGIDIEAAAPAVLEDSGMFGFFAMASAMLGIEASFNEAEQRLELSREGLEPPAPAEPERHFSEEDLRLLGKIVLMEGRDLGYEARLAIANVVLNRVKDPRFPDTVAGVIYQPNQFYPAHYDSFANLEPDALSLQAAEAALMGENNISTCLYFNNAPFRWKSQSELYKVIEGEYFYY